MVNHLLKTSANFRNGAFSLVELLVVISIIALMASLLVIGGSKYMKSMRIQSTRSSLEIIDSALDEYNLTAGGYSGLTVDPENFRTALEDIGDIYKITGAIPTTNLDSDSDLAYVDAWKLPFNITIPTPGDRPIVWSFGPDRDNKPANVFSSMPKRWSSTKDYAQDDFMIYGGEVYKAETDPAVGDSPSNSSHWIATGQIGTWD